MTRKIHDRLRRGPNQSMTRKERKLIREAAAALGIKHRVRFADWGRSAYLWGVLSGLSGERDHHPYGSPAFYNSLTLRRLQTAWECGRRDAGGYQANLDPELIRAELWPLYEAELFPDEERQRLRPLLAKADRADLHLSGYAEPGDFDLSVDI